MKLCMTPQNKTMITARAKNRKYEENQNTYEYNKNQQCMR